ncbi:MAG TPA: hypothetical protein VFV38_30030, partial [Ktedonobacteraceae bacterium]|nr:hypothetical protein [Ktedonobacteraceae bacterium]
MLDQFRTEGWQQIEPENQYLYLPLLWGQFAEVKQVILPGHVTPKILARSSKVRHILDYPVVLAFMPRASIRQRMQGIRTIRIAEQKPPPEMGEYALVCIEKGARWAKYHISDLGEEGMRLWSSIGQALIKLVEPGDWWPLEDEGETSQLVEAKIKQLEQARRLEALNIAQTRARSDPRAVEVLCQEVEHNMQQLARLYFQVHQRTLETGTSSHRPPVLPALTSQQRTRVPQGTHFQGLAQSFGPGMATHWSQWRHGAPGHMEVITPNLSKLRVEGTGHAETAALQRYVTELLGPEGVKHLLGILELYYTQTGGADQHVNAEISLRQLLLRIGKGSHADDHIEQEKLAHTFLFLARTWITSDADDRATARPKSLAPGSPRRRKPRRLSYSPLIVLERMEIAAGPEGDFTVPEKVKFHLGEEFFGALFGKRQQYFTVPTMLLLKYHPVKEQQELLLALYLSNFISLNGGEYWVTFPTLLLQSALEEREDLDHGQNRTRDAARAIYAIEHLEQEGLIIRHPHPDVDTILIADVVLGATTDPSQAISAATLDRINHDPYLRLLKEKEPNELRIRRRQALQRLLREP